MNFLIKHQTSQWHTFYAFKRKHNDIMLYSDTEVSEDRKKIPIQFSFQEILRYLGTRK